MRKIRLRNKDIGRWVRTMWTNSSPLDGIIVSLSNNKRSFRLFSPENKNVVDVETYQILDLGNYVEYINTGLPGYDLLKEL